MPVTDSLFQSDAFLRHCEARVVECLPGGVVLDRTVFYPLGGGQPGDVGRLTTNDAREFRVVDTRKGESGRIRLLEIPGIDLQPCGGTHVARTSEIGLVAVPKVENKGRRNKRVYVVFA